MHRGLRTGGSQPVGGRLVRWTGTSGRKPAEIDSREASGVDHGVYADNGSQRLLPQRGCGFHSLSKATPSIRRTTAL